MRQLYFYDGSIDSLRPAIGRFGSATPATILQLVLPQNRVEFTILVFKTSEGTLTWRGPGQHAPRGTVLGCATLVCKKTDGPLGLHPEYTPVGVIVENPQVQVEWNGLWEQHHIQFQFDRRLNSTFTKFVNGPRQTEA